MERKEKKFLLPRKEREVNSDLFDRVSTLDRDAQEIKWELTHEHYIKEKFAQYYSWFMQIEKKIQQIDNEIFKLKDLLSKITESLEVHQRVIREIYDAKRKSEDKNVKFSLINPWEGLEVKESEKESESEDVIIEENSDVIDLNKKKKRGLFFWKR